MLCRKDCLGYQGRQSRTHGSKIAAPSERPFLDWPVNLSIGHTYCYLWPGGVKETLTRGNPTAACVPGYDAAHTLQRREPPWKPRHYCVPGGYRPPWGPLRGCLAKRGYPPPLPGALRGVNNSLQRV